MSIRRTIAMIARDLRLGRRSPIFMGVAVMPVVVTVLTMLDPPPDLRPRLGIVDHGRSEITSAVRDMDGIRLTIVKSADELMTLVRDDRLDGGLVLVDGFDAKVRAGKRPALEFYLSGESFPSRRVLLAVTMIDLVRKGEDRPAPVEVELKRVGDGRVLPPSKTHVLFLTVLVLTMAGIFVPTLTLVEERERGTLSAVLVTPARMSEVLVSKAAIGLLMAIPMSYLTLFLNSALPTRPSAVLVTLAVAALMCVETGLIFGTLARDAHWAFALMETLSILFIGTMLLCMGSSWAQFIAKLIPIYWFILPLYQIALQGAGLEDVWGNLAVALGIAAGMLVLIVILGRRMQAKLATT